MNSALWISVDGVEGTGISTLCASLSMEIGATVVSEFSDTVTGRALKSAVATNPHFISLSPIGQSLMFLGDLFENHARFIEPHLRCGQRVVSDRGYVSKYAYQVVVMEESLGLKRAAEFVERILSEVPPPSFVIYLRAPLGVLSSRIGARGEPCTKERICLHAES